MIHAKKILPEYFEALLTGRKSFEVRSDEDGEPPYSVGDYLALNEFDPSEAPVGDGYTGRCLLYEITYVLRGFELLQPGAVVLSLRHMPLNLTELRAMYGRK